jgi:hypothetical protein
MLRSSTLAHDISALRDHARVSADRFDGATISWREIGYGSELGEQRVCHEASLPSMAY